MMCEGLSALLGKFFIESGLKGLTKFEMMCFNFNCLLVVKIFAAKKLQANIKNELTSIS